MPRVKKSTERNKRKKKVMKEAKGFFGGRSKLYRTAKESVLKSYANAYVGRKLKKRNFRQLWIIRINAAARELGLSYNRFIKGLKDANIEVNRKLLADLAVNDNDSFRELVETVKRKLAKSKKK